MFSSVIMTDVVEVMSSRHFTSAGYRFQNKDKTLVRDKVFSNFIDSLHLRE